MGEFEGEIHGLCEEATWTDLKVILLSTLKSPSVNGTATTSPSSKRSSDENHTSPPLSLKRWSLESLQEALVTRKGSQQWTPLMIACVRAPLDVLALLCHVCPKACLVSDKSGCLPLHMVAGWRRDLDTATVLQILLECAPSSSTVVNAWGQTALHVALDARRSKHHTILGLDSLTVLLKDSREVLSIPDAHHRLPLHVAVSTPRVTAETPRLLELLVKHGEEACLVTDDRGNLPAHIMHGRVEERQIEFTHRKHVMACMHTLLSPLATLDDDDTQAGSVAMQKPPTSWAELHRMTNDYAREHAVELNEEEEESTVPPSVTPGPTRMACREGGSAGVLPIHMAAHYGVPPHVMEGICRQYPEGACVEVDWEFALVQDEKGYYDEFDTAEELEAEALEGSTRVNNSDDRNIAFDPDFENKGLKPSRLEDLDVTCPTGDFDMPYESGTNYSKEAMSNGDDEHYMGIHMGLQQISEEPSAGSIASSTAAGRPERSGEFHLGLKGTHSRDGRPSRHPEEVGPFEYRKAGVLEIFEHGWARQMARVATHMPPTRKAQAMISAFLECSDILFAYDLDAVNCGTSQRYMDKEKRWTRQENRLRREARSQSDALPESLVHVWSYLTMSNATKEHIRSVGNILIGLDPRSLWRLTVVPRNGKDFYISIKATGRTVAEEAEMRTPNVIISSMMKLYWFQHHLVDFLGSTDALNYSATCRQCRASGVRLLPQVPLRVTEASWDRPSLTTRPEAMPPKPWQRLDVLATPDYTHTIFVSYYVDCHFGDEEECRASQAFGGLMVVRDDDRRLRPNKQEPWGDAVVAFSKIMPVNGSLVRLSFPHVPGRTYGLWHYSHGGMGSVLSVSDVRVRQVIHSCNSEGRSPLHMLLDSMADQAPSSRLNMHVSMLLAAKLGSSDSIGDVPIHFALRCGVNEEVLQAIILTNPGALVETDKEGRTPIHAAFLLAKEEPPALGIIRALLTAPGENAVKLKDSAGRLPIHIAAARGAGEPTLRLLVDAYQDGCYRTNKDGDLPVHLLKKSGAATTTAIELLLRPIMENESICRIGGATGKNLPLHIATEYSCSYKVLEQLLQTYGDAARQAKPDGEAESKEKLYALDIFEQGRLAEATGDQDNSSNEEDNLQTHRARHAAHLDILKADFDLRSDLIFVYNPLLGNPMTGMPYRKDPGRIRRLEITIRREAEQCGEERKVNRRADLTDMVKQAWLFLCTHENSEDPSDNYAGTVRRILRGLVAGAVDVLAHVKNPRSEPVPNEFVKDCATPACSVLIMSRMRFVGRYALHDEIHPVHKSETCLVMRATDHGAADAYKQIMSTYDAQEKNVEDDISDAGTSHDFPSPAFSSKPTMVTIDAFIKFAKLLGIEAEVARNEMLKMMKLDAADSRSMQHLTPDDTASLHNDDGSAVQSRGNQDQADDEIEISKEAFVSFCRLQKLEEGSGLRMVVLKFMKRASQFHREKDVRAHFNYLTHTWYIVPILDDYNVDRITSARQRDIDDMLSLRDDSDVQAMNATPENKDELYALDIQEKNASVHNFALYKYAIVMPAGDRDLAEISQHEELGILQIREYMLQVGNALKSLHTQLVIHGDLKMTNVVRFGKSLALIDFDSTCPIETINDGSVQYMGAGSSKFCTGALPPEMIARIDLVSDFQQLLYYEDCWRKVSEDAKDLSLLTPDDIQTITNVVKSMVAKADVAQNLAPTRTLRDEIEGGTFGLENQDDWKDILSMALITLSFEDLPLSLCQCKSVEEFATIWNRLLLHRSLWEKVRPRVSSDERHAYVIKTYNDLPDESGGPGILDPRQSPYARVRPSETIDVWGFGLLLFALCSGKSLFQLDFSGNLVETDAFVQLYSWDSQYAEKIVRTKIDDPLAQDLLLRILATQEDRLPEMDTVLKHPFFGSSSDFEAQKILEKHEEQQLILEETVMVKRMTNATRRKVDTCMERQCKILFDQDKVVIPTCVVVLPYRLEGQDDRVLSVQTEIDLEHCITIGQCLLAINKATARLSFWLTMKTSLRNKNQSSTLKSTLKGWAKQARSEPVRHVAARMTEEIGCGQPYVALCAEVLSSGESAASVKDYLKDAMGAARREITDSTERMMQCYREHQLLYLVDEMNGVPVESPTESPDFGSDQVYPITVDLHSGMLRQTFLVFMNLAVMSATAREGLEGLAKLIGLPSSYGIPSSWRDGQAGLVHSRKPSSIAEFAVLQEVLFRQQQPDVGDELYQLEDFFRDFDPLRTFSDLRRVSNGSDGGPVFWTTEAEVLRMQSELEVASLEHRLRELKREWLKKKQVKEEIVEVTQQIQQVKEKLYPNSFPDNSEASRSVATVPADNKTNVSHSSCDSRRPSYDGRRPSNGSRGPQHNDGRRLSAAHDPPISANPQADEYPESHRRRKKRNNRLPFFGVC